MSDSRNGSGVPPRPPITIPVVLLTMCLIPSAQALEPGAPMKTRVGPPVAPQTAAQIEPDKVALQQAVDLIVKQTNDFRQKNDLAPLTVDPDLQKAAKAFAEFMSAEDRYGHRADGQTPAQRAKAAGYDYCEVRENIARIVDSTDNTGKGLGEQLTQGWIDSPPHRENMLADHVTQTGVGIATDKGLTFYGVQLFGRPASMRITFSIYNRTDADVTMVIGDADGQSDRDEMNLPPGYGYQFERCRSVTASLVDRDVTRTIDSSGNYEIRRKGDSLEFVKEDDIDQL